MANQVLEVIKSRRSTRAFTDRQVSECDIDNIIDAALYAPSGMNMQTWHFTVVQNTGKLQQLNDLIKGAFAKSDNPHLRERGNSDSYCCYYNAPTLIIVSNTTEQPWAGLDCACAIENMMLASTSLGIGSCWINQLGSTCDDVDVRTFITELGVPSSHKVFGCVALGYAIPDAPRKEKSIKSGLVTIVR
jgi:nitroreductase